MGCNSSRSDPSMDVSGHPGANRETLAERERKVREARLKSQLRHNLTQDVFGKDIRERYEMKEGIDLGEGAFATVVRATHRQTGQKYAVKVFKLRGGLSRATMKALQREVAIMKELDHPNIVRLQEVFQEERRLYLVMDLAAGGDLQTAFAANRDFFKDEVVAATVVRKVLLAVRYCHGVGVTHRDIKLENILLESSAPDAELKLTDFGLSVFAGAADTGETPGMVAGTVDYMAPEQVRGKAPLGVSQAPADLWSIGVVTYLLLSGYFPFYAASDDGVKLKIRWGGYKMPHEDFRNVSAEAKDFISKLLVKDPHKRLAAADALQHPWMARANSAVGPVSKEVVGRFRKFGKRTGMQKLALELIAHNLELEQFADLEKEFLKMDTDNTGLISSEEFAVAMLTQGIGAEEAAELFRAMDVYGTNQIAFNEFLAAALTQTHVTEQAVRAAFDRLDHDSTGVVTLAGLQLIAGADMTVEQLQEAVAEIDAGTGEVSYKQFRSAMRRSLSMTLLGGFGDDGSGIPRTGSKSSFASFRDGREALGGDSNRSTRRRGSANSGDGGGGGGRGGPGVLLTGMARAGSRLLLGDSSGGGTGSSRKGGSVLGGGSGVGIDGSIHGNADAWWRGSKTGSGCGGGGGDGIGSGSWRGRSGEPGMDYDSFPAMRRNLSMGSGGSKASARNLAALALIVEQDSAVAGAGGGGRFQPTRRGSAASSGSNDGNIGLTLDESLLGVSLHGRCGGATGDGAASGGGDDGGGDGVGDAAQSAEMADSADVTVMALAARGPSAATAATSPDDIGAVVTATELAAAAASEATAAAASEAVAAAAEADAEDYAIAKKRRPSNVALALWPASAPAE